MYLDHPPARLTEGRTTLEKSKDDDQIRFILLGDLLLRTVSEGWETHFIRLVLSALRASHRRVNRYNNDIIYIIALHVGQSIRPSRTFKSIPPTNIISCIIAGML